MLITVPARIATRAAAVAGVMLLAATACTAGHDDDASPPASPTTSGEASAAEPWAELPEGFFVVQPDEQPLHQAGEILGLTPARIAVEDHDGFERLVVEFTREHDQSAGGGNEGLGIELYVGAVSEPVHDGSGVPIEIHGVFFLQLSIPGVSPLLDPETSTWVDPPEAELLETGLIQDVVYDGFEGGAGLYVALSSADTEYRISQDAGPLLIYIDVRET